MRTSLSSGLALALLMGIGLAACSDVDEASVPPGEEPAQTGSLPAEPAPLPDPAMAPDPAITPPPAEEPAQ
jgi:hypothetical protein